MPAGIDNVYINAAFVARNSTVPFFSASVMNTAASNQRQTMIGFSMLSVIQSAFDRP